MRYALVYGLLSGSVIVLVLIAGLTFGGVFHSEWFGYLIMLVALTFVFVGVKRYRDVEKGGVIKFLPALGIGLGIAAVATLAYVLIWEVYLALTNYAFIEDYIASQAKALHAHGVTGQALAAKMAEFDWMRGVYANPLLRMMMTSVEILPVAVLWAFISAVVLMFPKVLPARAAQ